MRHDPFADAWVATDALGRVLPGADECGPPRANRFVGIFYFIARNYDGQEAPRDVTKLLHENPDQPQFWPGVEHHWGEPELGYYRSSDPWVIRKHAYMLADAGVDTLIFDVTNDVTFPQTYETVCRVFREVRGEGEPTPDICFLGSQRSIFQLWERFYAKGEYADLWFHWQGKPLLLFGQFDVRGDMRDVVFPDYIQDFFTIRWSWAWDSLPWYPDPDPAQLGRHRWPWVAHYPQCVGWDRPGVAEHVPVAIAQHPVSGIGRSYHNGEQPPIDRFDETPFTAEGLHFAEQWRRALEIDPEFIFVTGWNEWSAGAQICDTTDQDVLRDRWSFFPGAVMGRATRSLRLGDVYFIDQYNREFSRDAEPMRGYHTDNYYYQLIDGVRRFKGVRSQPPASQPQTIDLDGDFSQWDQVQPEYRDHLYDTLHRCEAGWGAAGPYEHTAGRNEFVVMKTTFDAERVYFYVRTRGPISPHTDPYWMLLFINANQRKDSGWEGYDFVVNLKTLDARRTIVQASAGAWDWRDVGEAAYRVEGNQLALAIPRNLLGFSADPLSFDFHWADNIAGSGRIEDFFDAGDSAPPRRFDYRFSA